MAGTKWCYPPAHFSIFGSSVATHLLWAQQGCWADGPDSCRLVFNSTIAANSSVRRASCNAFVCGVNPALETDRATTNVFKKSNFRKTASSPQLTGNGNICSWLEVNQCNESLSIPHRTSQKVREIPWQTSNSTNSREMLKVGDIMTEYLHSSLEQMVNSLTGQYR